MSSETPLLSEVVLYGLMLLNALAVVLLLWRARRAGWLATRSTDGELPFLDDDPPFPGANP